MPWLAPTLEYVHNLRVANRLPHAMLLPARAGDGGEILALELASVLLCEASQLGYSCGQCKSCLLLQAGSHPDLKKLVPEGKSHTVGVDAVRELVERFATTSQISRNKVGLILRADTMNRAAANALLKTLEEPAANAFLILVTEGQRPLLPTVRSRCQPLPAQRPTLEQTGQWLRTQNMELPGDQGLVAMLNREPLRIAEFLADNRMDHWQHFSALMQGLAEGKVNPVVAVKALEKTPLELSDQLQWVESALHRHEKDLALRGDRPSTQSGRLQTQLQALWRELAPGVTTNRTLLQEHLFMLWQQFNRAI